MCGAQELGLRDAALFEAWVEVTKAKEGPQEEEEAEEDLFPRVTALPSLRLRTYPHERAEMTPKDLQRAARLTEPDDELTHDFEGQYLPDGTEVWRSSGLLFLLN